MRKILFAVLLVSVAPAAYAGQQPSHDFAVRSLNALTSAPTLAAARWMELGRRRPSALLGAIASAERQGWKPTSTATLLQKGRTSKSARPVAARQDLYAGSADGEMLVWNWDDGNPSTGEGTVWVHSFATGNEVTFNVQWAGDTYDTSDISYYEAIDGVASQAWVVGAAALSPAASPGVRALRVQVRDTGQCEARGEAAGLACIERAAKDYLRDGVRSAATGALVGGAAGAWAAGLAGGIAGAIGGVLPGFASGVLGSLLWGTDHACLDEARNTYSVCILELEQCSRTLKGCGGVVATMTWRRDQ